MSVFLINLFLPSAFVYYQGSKGKGKAVPLQAWSDPEGSRKLRFPDFTTTAQDGGKVISLVLISVRG
jgi:hypothetical protein